MGESEVTESDREAAKAFARDNYIHPRTRGTLMEAFAFHRERSTEADGVRLAEQAATIERLKALLRKARPLVKQDFDVSKPWVVNEIDAELSK